MQNNQKITDITKIELEWFDKESQAKLVNLKCNVCSGILNKPILLNCGHYMCKNCFVSKNNICYICINSKNKKTDSWKIYLENCPFFLITMINIKCTCINPLCGKTMNYFEMLNHIPLCEFNEYECKYHCGDKFINSKLKSHEENCSKRPIVCEFCGVFIEHYENYKNHLQSFCDKNITKCKYCLAELPYKDINEHCTSSCSNPEVQCKYFEFGCKKKLHKLDLEEHLLNDNFFHQKLIINNMVELRNQVLELENKIEKISKKSNTYFSKLEKTFTKFKNKKLGINNKKENETISISLDESIQAKIDERSGGEEAPKNIIDLSSLKNSTQKKVKKRKKKPKRNKIIKFQVNKTLGRKRKLKT